MAVDVVQDIPSPSGAEGSGMKELSTSSLPRVCPPPENAPDGRDCATGAGPALKELYIR